MSKSNKRLQNSLRKLGQPLLLYVSCYVRQSLVIVYDNLIDMFYQFYIFDNKTKISKGIGYKLTLGNFIKHFMEHYFKFFLSLSNLSLPIFMGQLSCWRGGVIDRIESELIQYKINYTDKKSWVDRDSTLRRSV